MGITSAREGGPQIQGLIRDRKGHKDTRRGQVMTGTKAGGTWPPAQGRQGHQQLEGAGGPHLEPQRERGPTCPDVSLQPQDGEGGAGCCRSPGLRSPCQQPQDTGIVGGHCVDLGLWIPAPDAAYDLDPRGAKPVCDAARCPQHSGCPRVTWSMSTQLGEARALTTQATPRATALTREEEELCCAA